MADRELELETLLIAMTLIPDGETVQDELEKVIDAIHAASDQDTTTWLLAGGKRVAKIVPVDEIPGDFEAWFARFRERVRAWEVDQVKTWLNAAWDAARIPPAAGTPEIPVGISTWARDAGVDAAGFMALPLERRRVILDLFYAKLHGEQYGGRLEQPQRPPEARTQREGYEL